MGTDTLFSVSCLCGSRHVGCAQKQSGSKLPHSKRFAPANAHCVRGSALETIGISALFLATESQRMGGGRLFPFAGGL